MPPHETLAAASSRPNFEALVARMVLAHSCVAFHLYMCGLREDAITVAIVLIDYNDVDVAARKTTRRQS
jgi:hypothetical protein